MADEKEIVVLSVKAALATLPFCGGIAEVFGWGVEERFVNKRLFELEQLLGKNDNSFLREIKQLDEHEYYAMRKLLKFHCFEALPELTPITARAIISYALEKQDRGGDDQIIEILCQLNPSDIMALRKIKSVIEKKGGDYSAVVKWSDVRPVKTGQKDGIDTCMKLSDMILTTAAGSDDGEASVSINRLAISYSKLHHLKVINTFHNIYAGLNTDVDIEEFFITPFGIRILGYVDLGRESEE